MDPMELALQDLNLQDKPNISATANKHQVVRSTLSRRFNGVTQSHKVKCDNQALLSTQQERTLVQYINKLTELGIPPTVGMVGNMVHDIVGKWPGKTWSQRFCKRWKSVLSSKYLTTFEASRFKADSEWSYRLYFDLVKEKIQQYDVQPHNTYNMDEKGFLIGYMTKTKRIFTKAAYDSGRLLGAVQDGSREWITLIATICADGTSLSPGLIYKAVSGNLQDSWVQDFDPTTQHTFMASSPSGWTNDELGLSYIKSIFDRETKAKARNGRDWRLLFVDGHGSHINIKWLEYCQQHRILIAVYPPHSTHRLQPLDVSLFSPMAVYYSQELHQFTQDSQGISKVTKRDFFRLFWQAYPRTFTSDNIASGWSKTGLHPFNPAAVLNAFSTNPPPRPESKDSIGSSAYSASNWRGIQNLLKELFAQAAAEGAARALKNERKVKNTIDHLTTDNILLKKENKSLKKAQYHEKKKNKRGKHSMEEFRAEDGQGATFFSPMKIETAKHRLAEKEQAKEDEKAEKAARALEKSLEKQAKRLAVQERKLQRQKTALAKKEAALAKATARTHFKDTKNASQQLAETLQASVKKPKSLPNAAIAGPSTSCSNNVVLQLEEPNQPMERQQRTTRLPKRFQD